MAELKYSILFLFMMSACSQATSNIKVTINNNLSSCIKIDSTDVVYNSGIPMLYITHQQLKPTSECGCKSIISQYSSQLEMGDYNSELLAAKFIFGTDKFNIPLATSKKIIGEYSVLVSFSCALPD